jgi:DNA polymerase-3 subunit delta
MKNKGSARENAIRTQKGGEDEYGKFDNKCKTLKSRIIAGEISRVYLFCGEEEYPIHEYVELILEKALDPKSKAFNYDVLFGNIADAETVVSRAIAYPMMSDQRVVVVKEFEKLVKSDKNGSGESKFQKKKNPIVEYLEHPAPTTVLILIAGDVDLRNEPYKTLNQKYETLKFMQVEGEHLVEWIKQQVRKLTNNSKEINSEACDLLIDYVGNSLGNLVSELRKILIFVGDGNLIDDDCVSKVVGASKIYSSRELEKAIGERKMEQAIQVVERGLQEGKSATQILNTMSRFLIALLQITDLKQTVRRPLQIFVLGKALRRRARWIEEDFQMSNNYPISRLENCFRYLVEADETLKTKRTDAKVVLTLLVYNLIKSN